MGIAKAVSNRLLHILKFFLITGVLGGFTTFSTFSLEAVQLFEQGAWQTALGYVALSLLSCVSGAALGLWVVKALG